MSTNQPVCTAVVHAQRCDRPIRDNAHLCHRCTGWLQRELGDVRALADEVETTRLRQSRTGDAPIGGGHASDKPVPWDDRPVKAARDLREQLLRWAALILQHRGGDSPRTDLPGLAGYLLNNLDWLRHRTEAPDAKHDLERAIARLRRTVDRTADRRYYGRCGSVEYDDQTGQPQPESVPCPADLYGRPDAFTVVCEVCATEHETSGRQEWLLTAVEDQLAHPALLSKALSNLGRPVSDATIRSWVARGRLVAHGADDRGRAVYRVGDVLELVAADAARQAQRSHRAC